jgi:hypothetical protein
MDSILNSLEKSKGSILCLYYPQQLLPALTAIQTYRQHKKIDVTAPLYVLIWISPATNNDIRSRRLNAFHAILQEFPWITILAPNRQELMSNLSPNTQVNKKAIYLRKMFGKKLIDAVYYSHDISADFIAQSTMQAFPAAERICFGDALGVVYTNNYFTEQAFPVGVFSKKNRGLSCIGNLIRRIKRSWTLPRKNQRFDANYAVLILPCDPGGDFLPGKKLLQVPDGILFMILNLLSTKVEQYVNSVKIESMEGIIPSYVMLLGSFCESRLITEAREIELYIEVARQHVLLGRRIVLKGHPVSSQEKINRIANALRAANFEVSVTSTDELPIELMPSLIMDNIILSLSYSSISLTYLYGAKVRHVLDRDLIHGFFPKSTRSWILDSNKLYLEQLEIAVASRNNNKQREKKNHDA